jgi:hypothetical protein
VLTATVRYREPDVVGGPVSRLPQDLHFEESHGWVDSISKGGWPEIQAGLLVRHFHDWQRVRPRPQGRGRDRGRPTRSVVGRHPVRVEEGDGTRSGDSGERIGAVACMAETLRHRVRGHRASLNEEDGAKRKERLRESQSGERETTPLYPSKAALNHFAFSGTEPRRVTGGSPATNFTF